MAIGDIISITKYSRVYLSVIYEKYGISTGRVMANDSYLSKDGDYEIFYYKYRDAPGLPDGWYYTFGDLLLDAYTSALNPPVARQRPVLIQFHRHFTGYLHAIRIRKIQSSVERKWRKQIVSMVWEKYTVPVILGGAVR